jgi:hypothetical protein
MSKIIEEMRDAVNTLRREEQVIQAKLLDATRTLSNALEAERRRLRNPKLSLAISGDYAALTAGECEFYYGYEVTHPPTPSEYEDAEWCFQAKRGAEIVATIPSSALKRAAGIGGEFPSPERLLLVGIGLLYIPEDAR